MNVLPRWLATAPAAVLAVLASGCAELPRNDRTVLAGSASELLVVLPFTVTATLPARLASSRPGAWKELTTYLKAHAIPIKTLAFPTARRLWLECVREARAAKPGTRSGFDEAAGIFVARLSQHVEFDTLVIPTLFVQGAPISGRTASWDRAEHPIEFDRSSRGVVEGQMPQRKVPPGVGIPTCRESVVDDGGEFGSPLGCLDTRTGRGETDDLSVHP